MKAKRFLVVAMFLLAACLSIALQPAWANWAPRVGSKFVRHEVSISTNYALQPPYTNGKIPGVTVSYGGSSYIAASGDFPQTTYTSYAESNLIVVVDGSAPANLIIEVDQDDMTGQSYGWGWLEGPSYLPYARVFGDWAISLLNFAAPQWSSSAPCPISMATGDCLTSSVGVEGGLKSICNPDNLPNGLTQGATKARSWSGGNDFDCQGTIYSGAIIPFWVNARAHNHGTFKKGGSAGGYGFSGENHVSQRKELQGWYGSTSGVSNPAPRKPQKARIVYATNSRPQPIEVVINLDDPSPEEIQNYLDSTPEGVAAQMAAYQSNTIIKVRTAQDYQKEYFVEEDEIHPVTGKTTGRKVAIKMYRLNPADYWVPWEVARTKIRQM